MAGEPCSCDGSNRGASEREREESERAHAYATCSYLQDVCMCMRSAILREEIVHFTRALWKTFSGKGLGRSSDLSTIHLPSKSNGSGGGSHDEIFP